MPDDQLPVMLPDAEGPRPEPEGHLAAGRRDRLGQRDLPDVRRPGDARHRHDGHLRRLVLVLPALRSPHDDRPGRSTRRGRTRGCRSTSTSAASSTRSCTCCTRASSPRCCTTWAWSTSREPFTRLLNQGMVIIDGTAMSKSRGNGVDLGDQLDAYGVDAVRLTHGLRRPAGGRHRLGGRVAGRVAAVPAAGLAAGGRRHLASPAWTRVGRRPGAARVRPRGRCTTPPSWSRATGSTSSSPG